ncbi:uncharacterized protein B0I36DRAFT_362369 [Microdochium trichocladiopsis]|uniref:Xylanolytic transcriptional activator regulatory domain-containing protein n=1 Tax=Microdochium trichocladiopsis TaxID=1682393 RepID=A0A9P8YCE4_9PEZI|nr:uncharacterized protein B0I36DRAFT_362369 [Microdochium trichocladiopsis]KAH7033734.1 hypothetical protein B0I36DRAFT_362369 [Microdochium trichocladiopsis]
MDNSITSKFHASMNRSPSLEMELLGLFERWVNPIHKFLDEKTTQALQLELGKDWNESPLLRLAVLSAGSLITSNKEARAYGDALSGHAESIALAACRRQPNIGTIQALSLLAWRELGLDNENMAWLYILSSLKPLSEVVSTRAGPGRGFSETLSVRAQTFWAVLLQERIATSLLGRHPLIPSGRVQSIGFLSTLQRPPTLDETVFDLHCELWFLHDKYMDKIYSFDFAGLELHTRLKLLVDAREDLSVFHKRLSVLPVPQSRGTADNDVECAGPLIFCRMSYHMSQLLIHRPYLGERGNDNALQLSAQTSWHAADAMARLVRTAEKRGLLTMAPVFVVHSILTAAVTLLMFSTSQQTRIRSQAVSRFRTCFNAILLMVNTWPRAARGIAVLRELAYRWKVVATLPLQHSMPLGGTLPLSGTKSGGTTMPTSAEDLTGAETMEAARSFPLRHFESGPEQEGNETRHFEWPGVRSFDPLLFSDLDLASYGLPQGENATNNDEEFEGDASLAFWAM